MGNKKTISLFLVVVFFCTLTVMPESRTDGSDERSTNLERAGADRAPLFCEAEQEKEINQKVKKFPWLLAGGIVVGAALGVFLVFSVFKKKDYDIRGTWELDLYLMGEPLRTMRLYFKGSKSAGDYSGDSYGLYSIEGKKAHFGYGTHGASWGFDGKFDGSGRMSGTYAWAAWWSPAQAGTWWARKISSATGVE